MIMDPVVAGSFYSSNPIVLRDQINNFLQNVKLEKAYENPLGIISPHAGYIYSGQCAAYGFKALKLKDFELAVIIAPCHRYVGFEYSIGDFEAYRTPLGLAEVDIVETEQLLQDKKFRFISQAFNSENSLETQIPFLQVIKPDARIIPILIGNQSSENSRYLAENLFTHFKQKLEKVVFIASSDLSHYHNADTAGKMDAKIAECISNGDIEALLENIKTGNSEACGFGAILTLMYLSELANYGKIANLNYTHSGEVSHDNDHVVGYLSTIFYK
jgi:MEMO1 family protein